MHNAINIILIFSSNVTVWINTLPMKYFDRYRGGLSSSAAKLPACEDLLRVANQDLVQQDCSAVACYKEYSFEIAITLNTTT